MKQYAWLIIKIIISCSGLYYVIINIDLFRVISSLNPVNFIWLIPAFILYLFSKYITAIRYRDLLKSYNCNLSYWYNLKLYLCGMYYNLILPGGVSGDFYKAYVIHKNHSLSYKELVVISVKDRAYGAIAIVLLLLFLVCFSNNYGDFRVWGAGIIILIYVLYHLIILKFFSKLSSGFHRSMFLSIVGQLIQIFSFILLLKMMKMETQWLEYAGIFLISSLIASFPVTIGGIGARELTFYYFSNVLALDATVATASSMLFYLLTVASSLLGFPYSWMMNEASVEIKLKRN